MAQRAALFDVDGTLTSDNVWKGLLTYFQRRGERRWTHLAFQAVHYPLFFLRKLHLLSEADFRRPWSRHLPWYFRGSDAAQVQTLAEWVAREYVAPMGRVDSLAKLREHLGQGDVVALVSAAPLPIVQSIAQMWGVSHAIASSAEFKDGHYTGRMDGEPCIDEQKAVYARQYFQDHNLEVDFAASYAYADSYSDLGLFEMVGHPVAVYPDEKLGEVARRQGWEMFGRVKEKG
jgi:HAD superfamily hydrolase (TIGR01490 family)